MDLLAFMTDGFADAEIAERLFISPKTVEHHVSAIPAKLDAHTRGEAVSIALYSALIIKIGNDKLQNRGSSRFAVHAVFVPCWRVEHSQSGREGVMPRYIV